MAKKIWKVKGHINKYTDEELIKMIKEGKLKGKDHVTTANMKTWVQLDDSIYSFYLKEGKSNENIQH